MRAVMMSKRLVEILTEQQRLIAKYGRYSSPEPVYTALCNQLNILIKNQTDTDRWAKCLMLSLGGSLRCGAAIEQIAKRLDVYNVRWEPIRWMDVQRDLYTMQLSDEYNNWQRWCNITVSLLIVALSFGLSINELLSAVEDRLDRSQGVSDGRGP